MFFKQEKPELDDFERKKNFGSKRKIVLKMFFKDTLAKSSQSIFAYSFFSEHSKHFIFILREKTCIF